MASRFAFLERVVGSRLGAIALGVVLALLPRAAAAQTLPLDLTWRAPPECPQRENVLARASGLLGSKALKSGHVRAEGTIQKRDDGFELTLLIDEDGKGGERRVWARQCEELSGAAAITLVLLLTNGGEDMTDGQELKPPPPPPPPVVPPDPIQDRPVEHDAVRDWHLLVAAPQLVVGVGPLPKPTLGIGAGLGVEGRSWSVRALGQWFAKQSVAAPVEPYGADVKRLALSLWGCWDLHQGPWTLSPCLETSVTHLQATGYGPFLVPTTQSEMSLGAGVGAIGRLQALSWMSLMVSADLQMELTRPIILLRTVGTVRQLAPVSATVQLGPEWIF